MTSCFAVGALRAAALRPVTVRATGPVVAVVLMVGALAGCTGGPDDAPSGPTTTRPASPTATPGPSPSPSSPSPDGAALQVVPEVDAEATTVVEDLGSPWGLAPLPDGRLLVTSRDEGTVSVVDPASGDVVPALGPGAGDLVDATEHGGEGGLLGVAISPSFATDHEVFLYRTAEAGNEVLRGDLALDGPDGEPTLSELTPIIEGIPSAGNHNGGQLAFGPDGFLYVSTGDSTESGLAQDPGSLAGKILRVTTDGDPAPGNPTAGSRVWTLGHRNVQGLGWDVTGRMFASEFGQSTLDEVNVIVTGGNYGWPEREGTGGDGDPAGFVDPIATWPTSDASPSGLAVTTEGVYVAGLRGERMWRIPFAAGSDGEAPTGFGEPQALLDEELGRLRAVVARPDGGLWVLTNNTDGRGDPREGDDRLLSVTVT